MAASYVSIKLDAEAYAQLKTMKLVYDPHTEKIVKVASGADFCMCVLCRGIPAKVTPGPTALFVPDMALPYLPANLTMPTKMVESGSNFDQKEWVGVYSVANLFSTLYKTEGHAIGPALLQQGRSTPFLEELLIDFAATDMKLDAELPKVRLSGEDAKWRVISAMQKAIRRGDAPMAVKCALAMETFDAKYLWRRIAIIAFEDLGLACLPLTAVICALAGKHELRKKLDKDGGRRILAYIIEQMANLPKDRTLCELANAAHDYMTDAQRTLIWDTSVDRQFILDKYREPGDGVRAYTYGLSLVGGLKRKVPGFKTPDGKTPDGYEYAPSDRGLYMEWLEGSDLPPMVKYCVRRGISLGAEGLPVSLPLVWRGFVADAESNSKNDEIFVEENNAPPVPLLIRKLPSYAYDTHTLEGKKAIAYFLKSCTEVQEFLDGMDFKGDRMRFTGSAVFFCEGGLPVDRRLIYPTAETVLGLSINGEALRYGTNTPTMLGYYQTVAENLPMLNKARYLIVEGIAA